MVLEKDFREFIALLNEKGVKYLVIGGFAVNFHGYPRYTKDIDFWIWLTPENIQKLLTAINDFGFGSLKLNETDFSDPGNIIQLGYEPNRIDLLVEVEGIDFEKCYERRELREIDDTKVSFISLQDLIDAKLNAGRLQDLADADHLKKISARKGRKK
ncbi:MAG: hypothetical protein EPO28_14425 [Saprospiraceae bacterium]|nr:MAG: hypothetical protein EPO28_14425 [Saprospiraceae bacterium]